MKKFSIIIPVYNLEHYIEECVESILKQNYSDYEIILVDDGSIDRSGQICRQFASSYDFIKLIEKENGGASDARNAGIGVAEGEYILFVDGDDFISPYTLENINGFIQKYGDADVIFLEGVKIYPDGREVPINDGYVFSEIYGKDKSHVLKHLTKLNKFPASPCMKAIRRDFLVKKEIYFMKNLQIEDIDWSLKLYMEAEQYLYCPHVHYYYRQNRSGSETNVYTEKRFLDFLTIFNKWIKHAGSNETDRDSKILIYSLLAYEYIFLVWGYSFLSENRKKQYKPELKNLRWLLNFRHDKRTKLIKYTSFLAGIEMTAKLSLFYFRLLKFRF